MASGTAQEVFYIPQKPYNVIGTLIDQLTYPDTSGGEHLDHEAMLAILEKVDLTHLADVRSRNDHPPPGDAVNRGAG